MSDDNQNTESESESDTEHNQTSGSLPSSNTMANLFKKYVQIDFNDLITEILRSYGSGGTEEDQKTTEEKLKQYLKQLVVGTEIEGLYNVVVLYDSSTMLKSDADRIYNAITSFDEEKPMLLILYSKGGDIGSAYLIGQLCREHSHGKLSIVVPRKAKSAATLLCCSADEIHMGSLSELGPIDPQIKGLPVLGLKNSIEHIAKLVKANPESAEMFARYLNYSVEAIDLGYYERVAESAMQYAEKLLVSSTTNFPKSASAIAHDLVYAYKDHGFVLDKNESTKIFGEEFIKLNTPEYSVGNEIYNKLSTIENVFDYLDYQFYLIGCLDSKPRIVKKRN